MAKLFWFISLIGCVLIQLPSTRCRQVTNEDIKDVLLTVIHLLHDTQDKLERHELREKHLGEVVKRALGGLEKRHRGLEPIKGMLERLDERLAGVETVLMQNEERQRIQNVATNNTIELLVESIDALNDKVSTISKGAASTNSASSQIPANLVKEIQEIKSATNEIKQKLNDSDKKLHKIDDATSKVMDILTEKSSNVAVVLEKYENKLTEFNKLSDSSISYKEPTSVSSDLSNQFLMALNTQQTTLQQIVGDLQRNEMKVKSLPTLADISALTNHTMYLLQQVKFDLYDSNNKTLSNIDDKLNKIDRDLTEYSQVTNSSYTDLADVHKTFYSGTAKSYEQLHTELQSLSKIEKVMIQTGDNILDIKRRIEYGVHQILLEVGDLVKVQNKDLNGTVNKRFDDIELTILDNQSGALANLTTKFETEMSQVWRQIGIMYQQVTASNTALDRLQAQTENYVNGSLTTMDSMEGKVGKINTRMAEVDSNLNYLLGRLSLVTHDFNQIKLGLGNALDQIRGSFMAVQDKVNKVKDVGPGPHQIPETENEIDVDGSKDKP